jgi:hypothetical protein
MLALGGTMSIANASTSGLLSGVSISANPAANTVLLNVAGVKVTLNEQIVSGTQITVNAIHIKLTSALVSGLGLLTGDIIVSQSVASMSSCSGTIAPDNQLTGWIAPVTVSDFDFSSGSATLYRQYYNKADWGGDLQAYPVSATGVIDEAHPRWSGGAATLLNAQNYDTGRKIATVRTSDGALGVPGALVTISRISAPVVRLMTNSDEFPLALL